MNSNFSVTLVTQSTYKRIDKFTVFYFIDFSKIPIFHLLKISMDSKMQHDYHIEHLGLAYSASRKNCTVRRVLLGDLI